MYEREKKLSCILHTESTEQGCKHKQTNQGYLAIYFRTQRDTRNCVLFFLLRYTREYRGVENQATEDIFLHNFG